MERKYRFALPLYLPSQPLTGGLRAVGACRTRVLAGRTLGVRTANPVGGRGTRRRLVAAVACHAVACGRVTRVCTCRGTLRDACRARGLRGGGARYPPGCTV